jgi:hypothetical protein
MNKCTTIEEIAIDYNFDGCTDLVAFVLKGLNESGKFWSYISPYVFNNTEDAYHAACIEISGK